MKNRLRFVAGAFAGAVFLASCGSDPAPIVEAQAAVDPAPEAEAEAPTDTAEEAEAANAPVAATAADTELGEILAGEGGLSLYGFTNDVDAISACYGTCADAWPPVIVDADFAVAPGLDTGIFATHERDDGSLQLVAGKWPLYFFAGDAAPGDISGQGSGDVWFVVDTDGVLITGDDAAVAEEAEEAAEEPAAEPAAIVTTGETDLGAILVDSQGLSLYGFLDDVDGQPTCAGACADAWPPILLDGPDLPADLDPAVFSVATRDDGTHQLVAGVWPLYLFAGDAAPGDVNGQGSGDVWFLATPEGGLIGAPTLEPAAAPAPAPAPTEAPAPAEEPAPADDTDDGYDY